MAPLPIGTFLARRYVLTGTAGRGGVSTVYAAVDVRRGHHVAVKVLASGGPRASDDARREAIITDRLRHPSVPRVFGYGDAPRPDGSVVPYVVLELLAGAPLTRCLVGGPLDWPEAVRIAATAADVLAVAHRRDVVHRDPSPWAACPPACRTWSARAWRRTPGTARRAHGSRWTCGRSWTAPGYA